MAEFSPNYEVSNESYHSLNTTPRKQPQTAKAIELQSLGRTNRGSWSVKQHMIREEAKTFQCLCSASFKVYPYFLKKQQHKECVHHIEIFITSGGKEIIFFIDYWHKYLFLYCQPTNSKESSLKLWQVPGQPHGIQNMVIHKPCLNIQRFTPGASGARRQ